MIGAWVWGCGCCSDLRPGRVLLQRPRGPEERLGNHSEDGGRKVRQEGWLGWFVLVCLLCGAIWWGLR